MLWFALFQKENCSKIFCWLQKSWLIEQNFYSDLYLETCRQEKAALIKNRDEKEEARKKLITSFWNYIYLLFLFLWFDTLRKKNKTK